LLFSFVFLLPKETIWASIYSCEVVTHYSLDQDGDSLKEEIKKNIIKRYFEKRAEKKSQYKDSIALLKEKVLQEILRRERLKPTDTLYNAKPKYQFHYADLDFYLKNFKDSIYKTELDWAAIQRLDTEPFNTLKTSVRSNKFIYGFHPFWMGNAYYNYNFEIYNRIGYFGYVIDPEGGGDLSSPGNFLAHSWTSSTIQFKANYYNCKVDLCVASYDIKNNIKIFENSKNGQKTRAKVVENIVNLVRNKGDGVCFDIQKVPTQYKSNYIDLIQQINTLLNDDTIQKSADKKFQITVLLPRYDIGFPYSMTLEDAAILEKHVDRWIFTGESTYGGNFLGTDFSADNLFAFWNFDHIDFELNAIPPQIFKNMLMEVPLYYGKKIEGNDSSVVVSKFSNMAKIYPEFSSSFTNALQEKLTYIDLKGINGIALWCVGYDQNNEDVFNTLVDFIRDNEMNIEDDFVPAISQMIEQNNIDIVSLYKEHQESVDPTWLSASIYSLLESLEPKKVMSHHLIVLCVLIILCFVFAGFVVALFFESARVQMFSKENIRNFSTIFIVLIMVLLFKKFDVINEKEFVFAIGIFTGLILTLLFYRRRKKKDEELKP
jgi:hypothetical protein